MNFNQSLKIGQLGENLISLWLRNRGWNVMPVYEKELNTGKGPQFYLSDSRSLVAPDLFVCKPTGEAMWVEAKHKTVFSWHRMTNRWVTGIDLRHYNDYNKIDNLTPWPVWIIFLHREERNDKWDDPWPCPVGLYGRPIRYLKEHENHQHGNWGTSGMVYWDESELLKLDTLENVYKIAGKYDNRADIQKEKDKLWQEKYRAGH